MSDFHYMYVVECSDGSWYTGYTTDVERRVAEHNSSDLGAKYTRVKRPVSLVLFAPFSTRKQAAKAEYHFKLLSKLKKVEMVEKACGNSELFAELLADRFSIV